jgi:hypothetical protein
VAKKHGLPDSLVDRLQGDDDEALDADAKELAKLLASPEAADTDAGRRNHSTKPTKPESLLDTYEFGKRLSH